MKKQSFSRREFMRRAAAGIGAAVAGARQAALSSASETEQPNILYVFADQMRFCAMGCAGDSYIKTPNLDRLAGQGMLLTNAFSCTPLCSPYRAQLLTGRYGHTTGVYTNDIKLPESEITIAKVLKGRGYATGYIGKWHLNGGRKAPAGDPRKRGYVPVGAARQGFDYWAVLECSHRYFDSYYFGDTPTPIPEKGYEPDVQTGLAIEYMKQNKARPFLLMLSFGPPHNPYGPPKEYDIYDPAKVPLRPNVPKDNEETARRDIAKYYGLITSLDHEVGRMMEALDQLGIAGKTIFCFSADHGDMLYSHGWRLKQKPWEEACHVPFIMRYPDRIKAGQKKDVLLGSVDVAPTLLGLCSAPIPQGVQGLDLSQVLLGKSDKEPESVFLSNHAFGGGGGYVPPWRAVRTKQWLYAWSVDPKVGDWLLYDVKQDPYEMNNRVNDPACNAAKEKLRALLAKWRKDTGDKMDLGALMASRKGNFPDNWQEDKGQSRAKGRATPEVKSGEEPNGPARIDFQFDKDAEGWKAEKDLAPLQIAEGCLMTKSTGRQPSMILSPCQARGKQYSKVRIRMAVSSGREAKFFWTDVSKPRMSDPKSVTVPLQADGQFHDYVFPVGENPRWGSREITALRLDFILETGKPSEIRVDFIRGEK